MDARKIFTETHVLEAAGITSLFIKKVYISLRGCHQKVPWRRFICKASGAPKWIFILYLAILNRLYTRDRHKKWKLIDHNSCSLCETEDESSERLFLQVPISGYCLEQASSVARPV